MFAASAEEIFVTFLTWCVGDVGVMLGRAGDDGGVADLVYGGVQTDEHEESVYNASISQVGYRQ